MTNLNELESQVKEYSKYPELRDVMRRMIASVLKKSKNKKAC